MRRFAVSTSTALRLDWARREIESLPADARLLVIAPSRGAADDFVRSALAPGRGRIAVHRTTLDQLVLSLAGARLAEAGLTPASRLAVEALAIRASYRLNLEGALKYFGAVCRMPGFGRALASTLIELRGAGVTPESLEKLGESGRDLARLMEAYQSSLAEHALADRAVVFDTASAASEETGAAAILLLDVAVRAALEARFIRALATQAPWSAATAPAGDDETIEALSAALGVWAESLDESVRPDTALDRARRRVFSTAPLDAQPLDASVEFFSAAGEGMECVEIARRIRDLAARGTPFDRVGILLRSPDAYQPLVEDALRRAGIPWYSTRESARPDPRGRAFLALLECAAEGLSATAFAEYLSLGQAPEEVGAPAGFENLLVDAAVIGGKDRWKQRLRGLETEYRRRLSEIESEDESDCEPVRRRLERLERLRDFALPLIDQLARLPEHALWRQWLTALEELALRSLRSPEPVVDLLAELRPMAEVGPVGLDEVRTVLADRLRFLRPEPPHRRYGRVLVCSIAEAAARQFDAVFVPGLAEAIFPAKTAEDPLLLDDLRRQLDAGLAVDSTRVTRERLLLRLAAGAARRLLVVSYPRLDVVLGRARVPSFYALEVLRAAEGRLPEVSQIERHAASGTETRLGWPAPSDPAAAIDDAEYDLAWIGPLIRPRAEEVRGRGRFLLEANPHLARSLRARAARWRTSWFPADGLVDPGAGALKILAGERIRERAWSPSALQQFAVCPYRFFLHGIHRLRPREEKTPLERLDPLTRGFIFHRAQFRLFRRLRTDGLLPVTADSLAAVLDAADQVIDVLAREQAGELAPAVERVWRTQIESLRADLRAWIKELVDVHRHWRPIHAEFAFGLGADPERDPASVASEAVVLDGVRLRGSIDAVEQHIESDMLRVVDHKTGRPPEDPPQVVGHGEVLQPLLYALAAEKLLGKRVFAGLLFYSTERGAFTRHEIAMTAEARQSIADVLSTIDASIAGGFLPAAPRKNACQTCDYHPVCGPYEEERVGKKKPERLNLLDELRSMP